MFIVFDGIDGAGKSTQIDLVGSWLESLGHAVSIVRDPGSTPLGNKLRAILLEKSSLNVSMRAEMFLFMAARTQMVEELIRPALAAGKTVLCDRYTISTAVYQGHAGGLSVDEIWSANQIATGGLMPDLTLIYDLPEDVALARLSQRHEAALDKMESRGREYFARVRHGFLKESRRWPVGVDVIDATGSVDAIFGKTRASIEATSAFRKERPR